MNKGKTAKVDDYLDGSLAGFALAFDILVNHLAQQGAIKPAAIAEAMRREISALDAQGTRHGQAAAATLKHLHRALPSDAPATPPTET